MNDLAMQEIEVDGITKYRINFPLTDEQGQPILDRKNQPRMTNLIADSPEQLVVKVAEANIAVARALDRANKHIDTLKNKKPTPARPVADLKGRPLTQDEQVQVGLDAQDPRKAAAAIQRVVESVVPVAQITEEVKRQAQTLDLDARRQVAREFFARHREYNNSANGGMLGRWVSDNGYEFTLDNLEIAFAAIEDRLAKNPVPVPPVPHNEPPAMPPSNVAPGNEPPSNPGNPPPQRRAPVGGIRNDQVSGAPVTRQSFPYTRDQLLKMAWKQDPKYDELIRNPATNAMVTAVLSGR